MSSTYTNPVNDNNLSIGNNLWISFITLQSSVPLIITFSIILLSIFSSTILKGVAYLSCLSIASFIRYFILYVVMRHDKKVPMCDLYSVFMVPFVMTYLIYPMLAVGEMNWGVFSIFFSCLIYVISAKTLMGNTCNITPAEIIAESGSGVIVGILITSIMYNNSFRKYLFVSETTDVQTCSMAKKQSFKCSMYNKGRLVSSTIV